MTPSFDTSFNHLFVLQAWKTLILHAWLAPRHDLCRRDFFGRAYLTWSCCLDLTDPNRSDDVNALSFHQIFPVRIHRTQ